MCDSDVVKALIGPFAGEHRLCDANDSYDRAEVASLLQLGAKFVLHLDDEVDQGIDHRIALEYFVTERVAQSCRQVSLFGFLQCWIWILAIAVGRAWDIPVADAAPMRWPRTRRAW